MPTRAIKNNGPRLEAADRKIAVEAIPGINFILVKFPETSSPLPQVAPAVRSVRKNCKRAMTDPLSTRAKVGAVMANRFNPAAGRTSTTGCLPLGKRGFVPDVKMLSLSDGE
jgi:hypothetical protein